MAGIYMLSTHCIGCFHCQIFPAHSENVITSHKFTDDFANEKGSENYLRFGTVTAMSVLFSLFSKTGYNTVYMAAFAI